MFVIRYNSPTIRVIAKKKSYKKLIDCNTLLLDLYLQID